MRFLRPYLLVSLTVCTAGGSLVLFAYFLLFGTPFTINIAHSGAARLGCDTLLCLIFFVQHSCMIRHSAKERIAKLVDPIYYPVLYAIASGTVLFALVLLWQPSDQFLFCLHGPARWVSVSLSLMAIAGSVWGVLSLRWFDPFGTLALKAHLRGASPPALAFVAQGAYRCVRHPLYLCMLLLIWSAPRLSTDRLLFNVLWTAWIVIGTKLEERDLLADFGEIYRRYQLSVPMLIPSPRLLRRHT